MANQETLLILGCACGQQMKVPAGAFGKVYKCVRCGEHIKVQDSNLREAPASAAAPVEAGISLNTTEPVGSMLKEHGLINAAELTAALEEQQQHGGKTFEILIQQGALSKEDLHAFLSRQPGIATIDLARVSMDRALLELIPKELALEHLVLPIDRLGKLLTVAMACPLDTVTIAEVESITGLRVKAMLCRLDDIHAAVEKYYRPTQEADAEYYSKLLKLTDGGGARNRNLGQALQKLQALPCKRKALQAITALLGRKPVDLRALAQELMREPPLAALVLQKANTPAYGLAGRVESVPMAVALLGPAALQQVMEETQGLGQDSDMLLQQLSERGARAAAVAAALARASGQAGPSVAASAALLHQLGRHALLALEPTRYQRIDAGLTGSALATAEQKAVGADHIQAGAQLAAQWRLPLALQTALQHQLEPAGAGPHAALAALVHVAAALAASDSEESAAAAAEARGSVLKDLGLDPHTALHAVSAA